MKKTIQKGLFVLAAIATLGGCSYAGVAATPDGHAVVAVNNAMLFGMLRKVYVCKVTPGGLTACNSADNP